MLKIGSGDKNVLEFYTFGDGDVTVADRDIVFLEIIDDLLENARVESSQSIIV